MQTSKENKMKNLFLKSLSSLHKDEAGQGLVEYALIIALVAFAAVIAMQTLANDINNAFTGIGTILSSYVP
jgi:pilus assembly protein Flp/PilA